MLQFATEENRLELSRAAARGELRRVARGVYTDDLALSDDAVVDRYRWELIAHFVPDAIVVDRSAAANGGLTAGTIHVASEARRRPVTLPGLTIAVRAGPHLASDMPWRNGITMASPARTLVDNLAVSRPRGGPARTLDQRELGDWVARLARLHGPERLNIIRDEAKRIAAELGAEDRTERIDALVSAALGTGPAPEGSAALRARAVGRGFDEDRLAAFDRLASALAGRAFSTEQPEALPEGEPLPAALPFWEAYFSNYIEGTMFAVDEAAHIVADGHPPEDRPADGHDILGTYRVLSDHELRSRVARDPDDLLDLTRRLHREIMAGRPEKRPGEVKLIENRAGGYRFVAPDLVEGTLTEGFAFRERLANPFSRALFMFFLVSEVHPFDDGNGRVARAIMNTELSAAGQARVIVPIVWRNEYFTGVRQLSRAGDIELYLRTLAFAWRWTAAMNWADARVTEVLLEQTNALMDSTEAEHNGRRLLLPQVG